MNKSMIFGHIYLQLVDKSNLLSTQVHAKSRGNTLKTIFSLVHLQSMYPILEM